MGSNIDMSDPYYLNKAMQGFKLNYNEPLFTVYALDNPCSKNYEVIG